MARRCTRPGNEPATYNFVDPGARTFPRAGAYLLASLLAAGCFGPRAGPAAADSLDSSAHVRLTDGLTAASPSDSEWVTLHADSTTLPKTFYTPDEFSMWGLNAPHTFAPTRNPQQFELLKEANIRGVRYDILWGGLEQNGPGISSFNWGGLETDIDLYVQNGFTVRGMVDYTPGWANGLRGREFPPCRAVERELVDLASGVGRLQHAPVIISEPDVMPVVITPENPAVTRISDEVLTTSFSRGLQPRCSNNPVVVGTEQVWVDQNDGRGWVLWARAENLLNAPDGAEQYEFDRSGRVKFRDNARYYYHGRTPSAGSKVKISYDAIDELYEIGAFDNVTGVITLAPEAISGAIASDDFTSPILDSRWQWMNAPESFTTGDGTLRFAADQPVGGPGHFLHQILTGSGNFSAHVRVERAAKGSGSETGVMIYQDADNWIRFTLPAEDTSRPLLTRCENGVVTVFGLNGEVGMCQAEGRWLNIRVVDGRFTVFTSSGNLMAPEDCYQWTYSFRQTLSFPLKVGICATGTDGENVVVDQFVTHVPNIPPHGRVLVSYDYLDTSHFTNFLRQLVGHFKDRIKHWEVWNEPNEPWVWRGGQEVYAQLVKAASQAIRETDPGAQVVTGGYANGTSGNLWTIYQNIPPTTFDAVAWHPYPFSNQVPDFLQWATSPHYVLGRTIMETFGDAHKPVYFGEMATPSGVLAAGGGMNDWKQAEHAMRLFLWCRRMGYVKGIQWWPGTDLFPVGSNEDHKYGGHEGLFYYGTALPKPVFWMLRSVARNRGVLMDLGSYAADGSLEPPGGSYPVSAVVVSVKDAARLQEVRVLTSLTNTSESCRPPRVAARPVGQAGADPFAVNVNTGSPGLHREVWTLKAVSETDFTVTASVSGDQGLAVAGVPYYSPNGAVSFTIPAGKTAYVPGDYFEFETFAGDGLQQQGVWVNPGGLSGMQEIRIDLPSPVDARYVSLEFVKSPGLHTFSIDEVRVLDSSGANVAAGKLYIVDGYQPEFQEWLDAESIAAAKAMPDGAKVSLSQQVVYLVKPAFAYIEETSRAAGLRIEGNLHVSPGDLVDLVGTMRTSSGGERYLEVASASVTGTGSVRPLAANNKTLLTSLMDGLYVTAYGMVVPGSVTDNSFVIADGSNGGILVLTDGPPEVNEGDTVLATGAAGLDGHRVIHRE